MKKYVQAIGIWMCIIPLAILNGGLRENVLIKLGNIASPLSGLILSVCIFVVAFFLIPKIKDCKRKDYVLFGAIWFVLTNLFDLSMILSDGGSVGELIKAYYFWEGNLWIMVVATTAVSPALVARIKRKW